MIKLVILSRVALAKSEPCQENHPGLPPHTHPGEVLEERFYRLSLELPFTPYPGLELLFPYREGEGLTLSLTKVAWSVVAGHFVGRMQDDVTKREDFQKAINLAEVCGFVRCDADDFEREGWEAVV